MDLVVKAPILPRSDKANLQPIAANPRSGKNRIFHPDSRQIDGHINFSLMFDLIYVHDFIFPQDVVGIKQWTVPANQLIIPALLAIRFYLTTSIGTPIPQPIISSRQA